MTASHALHLMLEGRAVAPSLVTPDLVLLARLAALLRADDRLRSVAMHPATRAQLRDRLLVQAGGRAD